jgi:exosortase/archaeosortase family protein
MKVLTTNKYLMWIFLSFLLIASFFLSMFLFASALEMKIIIIVALITSFFIQVLLILNFVSNRIKNRLKIGMLTTHSLNLLFAIVIGFSISVMESDFKYNFGIVMIPLLLILSLVITDKYNNDMKGFTLEKEEKPKKKSTRPVIEFENKKYVFSLNSLIILGVGTPLLAIVIYFFFDIEAQFWLHEIVVKQTIYFLNLFFNMDVSTSYIPSGKYHWSFNFIVNIDGDPLGSIYFETFCTGIQAICVFAGIIICTPHSKDPRTNRDIIWRKAKALIVSSIIFYVVNVIRMLIQIELYYLGYPWDSIHVSISAASSFIAAIIILLLHKWIPEFIISIIYIGTLISNKVKRVRKPKE